MVRSGIPIITRAEPRNTGTNRVAQRNPVKQETGRYAFILPDSIAAYLTSRPPCDLQRVGRGFLMKHGYGLAVPKGSELLSYLNRALTSFEADGTLHRLYEKWWVKGAQCEAPLPARTQLSGRMFRSSFDSNSGQNVTGSYVWMCLMFCFVLERTF